MNLSQPLKKLFGRMYFTILAVEFNIRKHLLHTFLKTSWMINVLSVETHRWKNIGYLIYSSINNYSNTEKQTVPVPQNWCGRYSDGCQQVVLYFCGNTPAFYRSAASQMTGIRIRHAAKAQCHILEPWCLFSEDRVSVHRMQVITELMDARPKWWNMSVSGTLVPADTHLCNTWTSGPTLFIMLNVCPHDTPSLHDFCLPFF